MTTQEHLEAALRSEKLKGSNTPASVHIVNALRTFGRDGEAIVLKVTSDYRNRATVPMVANSAENAPRTWKPGEGLGKPIGLPETQTVETMVQPSSKPPRKERENQPLQKTSVSVVVTEQETQSNPFEGVTELPGRPGKVLEVYGIEAVRNYLVSNGIEFQDGASDREMASTLISNFKKA